MEKFAALAIEIKKIKIVIKYLKITPRKKLNYYTKNLVNVWESINFCSFTSCQKKYSIIKN
jgi:hypothetical protein